MAEEAAKQELSALYAKCGAELRRFAFYKTGNEEAANDLVQEAFVKLWEKRDDIDWSRSVGLLYTMIRNLSNNYHRHNQVRMAFQRTTGSGVDHEDPSYAMEQEEFRQRLETCIETLASGARVAFLMHRIETFKYREIAEKLEISVKAVEKRMRIAIRSLTQCMGQKI